VSKKKRRAAEERTFQLFDKLVKRLLRLSNRAVIRCINGLYRVDFPLDCPVDYPNPVSVNRKLQERRADMFITITHGEPHTYHVEVQTDDELNLIVRMFEYGTAYAITTAFRDMPPGVSRKPDADWVINFPSGLVLRWDTSDSSLDVLTLKIKFSENDVHDYKVPVFKLLNHSVRELEERGLLILLPFCVLKFRQRVVEATPEERRAFAAQTYGMAEELLAALERGERNGFLFERDTRDIVDSADQLLQELYHPYSEFTEVRDMMKGVYELRSDKMLKQLEAMERELEAERRNTEAERRNTEAERRNAEEERRNTEAERRNAEAERETVQNLERLGVSRELIERARNMR
jgi:hypothetical protein